MIRRIISQPTLILDTRAPYWHGERCEDIVQARIAQRAADKAAKRSKRNPSGTKGRTRSAASLLRRLERALLKRKTAAGRASVQARIEELTHA